jgi:hypothetical protein
MIIVGLDWHPARVGRHKTSNSVNPPCKSYYDCNSIEGQYDLEIMLTRKPHDGGDSCVIISEQRTL